MKRTIAVLTVVLGFSGLFLSAQSTDPAVQEAKAKLEVVYDLGRVFGYIHTMDKEQKNLALSADKAKALVAVGDKIYAAKRLEPKAADALLSEIENKILGDAQLMFVDGLALARQPAAESGTGAGSTGGTSPVQSYISGGPFNPMLDATKTLGKDFKAAYEYFKAKSK